MLFWFVRVREHQSLPKRCEVILTAKQSGAVPPQYLPKGNRFFHWLQSVLARLRRGFQEWLKP